MSPETGQSRSIMTKRRISRDRVLERVRDPGTDREAGEVRACGRNPAVSTMATLIVGRKRKLKYSSPELLPLGDQTRNARPKLNLGLGLGLGLEIGLGKGLLLER